jgi:hypothetical protein
MIARDMVGGVEAVEIAAHFGQFFRAIGGQRLLLVGGTLGGLGGQLVPISGAAASSAARRATSTVKPGPGRQAS